eukprot:scaffold425_cov365-Pavlova_lutheri.AAC.9
MSRQSLDVVQFGVRSGLDCVGPTGRIHERAPSNPSKLDRNLLRSRPFQKGTRPLTEGPPHRGLERTKQGLKGCGGWNPFPRSLLQGRAGQLNGGDVMDRRGWLGNDASGPSDALSAPTWAVAEPRQAVFNRH